jgi:hypothetical protein
MSNDREGLGHRPEIEPSDGTGSQWGPPAKGQTIADVDRINGPVRS